VRRRSRDEHLRGGGLGPIAKKPLDQFIFDCGSGVCANYGAMASVTADGQIFLNHLHGDHMSDLAHIYCFGPSADRKSPLYVFGPAPRTAPTPTQRRHRGPYDDGTKTFCETLRKAMRWHSRASASRTRATRATRSRPTGDHDPDPSGRRVERRVCHRPHRTAVDQVAASPTTTRPRT